MNLYVFFTYGVSLKKWHDIGILTRELALYQELSAKNVKVTLVTYGDSSDKEILKGYPKLNLIPIYELINKDKNKYIRFLKSFVYIPFKLRKKVSRADLFKSKQIFGAWVPAILSLFCKKKFLLRTGYDFIFFFKKNKPNRTLIKLLNIIFNFVASTASIILVATEEDKSRMLSSYAGSRDKIIVSPNWIDTDSFKILKTKKNNKVLFVGRLVEQKNLFLLIDSISNTSIELDIIGSGPQKEQLKEYAKERKANVIFIDRVNNQDLPKIYNQYNIFILPSKYEGNPKVLLEAMACGLCVIGTAVSGIKELLSNDNGILFYQNKEDIKEKLIYFLKNIREQEKFGINARNFILKNYTLKKHVDFEINLYKEILKDLK